MKQARLAVGDAQRSVPVLRVRGGDELVVGLLARDLQREVARRLPTRLALALERQTGAKLLQPSGAEQIPERLFVRARARGRIDVAGCGPTRMQRL